jgi:uncharacterized protein YjbJ (UPF0337 family)
MNKDTVEGKAKDIAGRVERQVGEWTGDSKTQAAGAAKQVEGKVQNAVGKVEDAAKKAVDNVKTAPKPPRSEDAVDADETADVVRQSRK